MKEIQKNLWLIVKKASFNTLTTDSKKLLKQALSTRYQTYIEVGKSMNEALFHKLLLADIKNENINIYNLLVNLSKLYYINKDFNTSISIHKILLKKLIENQANPKELLVEFYNLAVKYQQAKNPTQALNILDGYKSLLTDNTLDKEGLQTAIKSYILYISIKTDLQIDLQTLPEYGKKALQLIEKYTNFANEYEVHSLLAQIYGQLMAINMQNREFNKALHYAHQITQLIENEQIKITIEFKFNTFEKLSFIFFHTKEYQKCINYSKKALKIAEENRQLDTSKLLEIVQKTHQVEAIL